MAVRTVLPRSWRGTGVGLRQLANIQQAVANEVIDPPRILSAMEAAPPPALRPQAAGDSALCRTRSPRGLRSRMRARAPPPGAAPRSGPGGAGREPSLRRRLFDRVGMRGERLEGESAETARRAALNLAAVWTGHPHLATTPSRRVPEMRYAYGAAAEMVLTRWRHWEELGLDPRAAFHAAALQARRDAAYMRIEQDMAAGAAAAAGLERLDAATYLPKKRALERAAQKKHRLEVDIKRRALEELVGRAAKETAEANDAPAEDAAEQEQKRGASDEEGVPSGGDAASGPGGGAAAAPARHHPGRNPWRALITLENLREAGLSVSDLSLHLVESPADLVYFDWEEIFLGHREDNTQFADGDASAADAAVMTYAEKDDFEIFGGQFENAGSTTGHDGGAKVAELDQDAASLSLGPPPLTDGADGAYVRPGTDDDDVDDVDIEELMHPSEPYPERGDTAAEATDDRKTLESAPPMTGGLLDVPDYRKNVSSATDELQRSRHEEESRSSRALGGVLAERARAALAERPRRGDAPADPTEAQEIADERTTWELENLTGLRPPSMDRSSSQVLVELQEIQRTSARLAARAAEFDLEDVEDDEGAAPR